MKPIASILVLSALFLIVSASPSGVKLDAVIRRRRGRGPIDLITHFAELGNDRRRRNARIMRPCKIPSDKCRKRGAAYPGNVKDCEDCERVCTHLSKTVSRNHLVRAARATSTTCRNRKSYIILVKCMEAKRLCESSNSKSRCHGCVNTCTWTRVSPHRNRKFRVSQMKSKCGQLAQKKTGA